MSSLLLEFAGAALPKSLAVLVLSASLGLAQTVAQPSAPADQSPATTSSQTVIPNTPAAPSSDAPEIVPAPVGPVKVPTSMVLPGTLSGVSALLSSAGGATGAVNVQIELSSALNKPVKLSAARDNEQDCAYAPSVRVLRVGTREVVYPTPGAAPRLCAQDIQAGTLAAGGKVKYSRTLKLSPGKYMVEGWWLGLADGNRVKVPAQPVRVTVK